MGKTPEQKKQAAREFQKKNGGKSPVRRGEGGAIDKKGKKIKASNPK